MAEENGSLESTIDPESHVNVCVRIRPLLRDEIFKGHESIAWAWENNCILPAPTNKRYFPSTMPSYSLPQSPDPRESSLPHFYFDQIYRPEHSNAEIFATCVQPLVRQTMNGYHSSVFTYGQTASGKTHTMSGNVQTGTPGLIALAVQHCFDLIQEYRFVFAITHFCCIASSSAAETENSCFV